MTLLFQHWLNVEMAFPVQKLNKLLLRDLMLHMLGKHPWTNNNWSISSPIRDHSRLWWLKNFSVARMGCGKNCFRTCSRSRRMAHCSGQPKLDLKYSHTPVCCVVSSSFVLRCIHWSRSWTRFDWGECARYISRVIQMLWVAIIAHGIRLILLFHTGL